MMVKPCSMRRVWGHQSRERNSTQGHSSPNLSGRPLKRINLLAADIPSCEGGIIRRQSGPGTIGAPCAMQVLKADHLFDDPITDSNSVDGRVRPKGIEIQILAVFGPAQVTNLNLS